MKFDSTVRYLESHEWARREGDFFTVGVSDFAQDELGDVVFVELPALGRQFKKGEAFGVVESVKAASDVYLPLGGEVVEVNSRLRTEPWLVNKDPFGAGWLVRLRASTPSEYEALLDAAAYQKIAEAD